MSKQSRIEALKKIKTTMGEENYQPLKQELKKAGVR